MIFNTHSTLAGKHSFLSPSTPAWMNYDDEKLDRTYIAHLQAKRGTEEHAFAAEAIRLGIHLPRSPKTLNLYVNDAIGYNMTPEQTLVYSDNAFGTADAIAFRRGKLRVHDLKTGVTPASMKQLMGYSALFCLEYLVKPFDIGIELRIYQNDEVQIYEPEPHDIFQIMDTIVTFDKRIEQMKKELS